ncbi:MAG: tetratricopeptide repeat protein [Desulfatiglandales bacterium]
MLQTPKPEEPQTHRPKEEVPEARAETTKGANKTEVEPDLTKFRPPMPELTQTERDLTPKETKESAPQEGREVKKVTQKVPAKAKTLTKRAIPKEPKGKENGQKSEPKEEVRTEELVHEKELQRDFYVYQAKALEEKGEPLEAVEYYRKAVSLDKSNYKLHNKIASLCIQIKNIQCAQEHVDRAIEASPNYIPAMVNKGILLALQGKDIDAEKVFKTVQALAPSNRTALLNLAYLYERKGELQSAYEVYKGLWDLKDPEGALGIARTLEAMQKWDDAISFYNMIYAIPDADTSLKRYASSRLNILIPMIQNKDKNLGGKND